LIELIITKVQVSTCGWSASDRCW